MILKKPLVVLDLETTGTWIEKDRIIEIALVKTAPDGCRDVFSSKVNPMMPIPKVVTELTGISDADVKSAPTFASIAQKVLDFIGEADLGGFNLERFDLPLLQREMIDAGFKFDWQSRCVYDAQKVYHLHEKRDLSAALNHYCGEELKDAHSALADAEATLDILKAQITRHGKGNDCIEALGEFEYRQSTDYFDSDRKFRWWNGELYMTFGKYAKKEPLRVIAQKDSAYLLWILEKDFSDEVKAMIQDVLNGRHPKPDSAPENP
jgi:DNA polymerase III subunit epsilon